MNNLSYLKRRIKRVSLMLVLGLVLISGPSFAAASDYELAVRLADDTKFQEELGNPDYLKPALGEKEFKDPVDGVVYSPTGLKSSSLYIRKVAAGLILELGSQAQISKLADALSTETDPEAKSALNLYLTEMRYKFSADKEQFVVDWLADFSNGKFVPIESYTELFKFLLKQAKDNCMQKALEPLSQIKNRELIKDKPEMAEQLDLAMRILNFSQPYLGSADLEGLYEAAIKSNDPEISSWAISVLTSKKDAACSGYANQLLIKFLNSSERNVRGYVFGLKGSMNEANVLRSENDNPHLEPKTKGEAFPQGWSLEKKDAATVVKYPQSAAVKAHSFEACLEVENASGQTVITSRELSFKGVLPKAIDFGLFYSFYPKSCLILPEKPAEAGSIQLKATIHLLKGNDPEPVTIEQNPRQSAGWDNLGKQYTCPDAQSPIKSLKLEVIISGKLPKLYLDDIYVRRADDEFYGYAIQVGALNIPQGPVLTEEPVTLEAMINLPQDKPISGQWSSNLERNLGSEVSGAGRLVCTQKFSQPGEHYLYFTAINEFDMKTTQVAAHTLQVIKPQFKLTSPDSLQPAPKTLRLTIKPEGVENLGVTYSLNPPVLLVDNGNGKPVSMALSRQGNDYLLNTSALRSGYYSLQAAASLNLNRSGRSSSAGPFYSDKLVVYVENTTILEAVILADRQSGQSPLTVQFYGNYSKGNIASYQWSFGDGKTAKEANPKHIFANPSVNKPTVYTVKLTVSDTRGNKHTSQITVSVQPKPLAAA